MKSYTDIEQSRKLAEFLPIESADCYWNYDEMQKFHRISWFEDGYNKESQLMFNENNVCAWSLTALMAIIPYNVSFNKAVYRLKLIKYSDHWECYHENFGTVSTEIFKADNPVDACVAMIKKLHELKIL
jgi:hypothetical protein